MGEVVAVDAGLALALDVVGVDVRRVGDILAAETVVAAGHACAVHQNVLFCALNTVVLCDARAFLASVVTRVTGGRVG